MCLHPLWLSDFLTVLLGCELLAGAAYVTESDRGTEDGLWPTTTEPLSAKNDMSVRSEVAPATAELCDRQHRGCLSPSL